MMNNMVKKDLTQEIGSRMSGNFVCIRDTLTIREAMSELVRQAGVHDNIATLYVVDAGGVYAGAIDLKDLIIARENDRLADIIRRGYPYVFANERTADCAERIADYEEDSLPVLTEDRHIAGVLTAQALVDSAMGHVRLLNDCGFDDICISVKCSRVPVNMTAYRMLHEQTDYPLHLGVTEAGTPEMGVLKSAIGIGGLLCMGVGDTLRVSLTADPVEEVIAAKRILQAAGIRRSGPDLISCPTCGRTKYDMIPIAREVERRQKFVVADR